jgi:uncharacterized lipoprotein YmbA
MTPSKNTLFLFFPILIALLFPACVDLEPQADHSRFYILDPTPIGGEPEKNDAAQPYIYFPQITLPSFLTTTKLAVRESGTELKFYEDHRWAEPLDDSLLRALVSHIRSGLPENWTITNYPNRRSDSKGFEVQIQVEQLEGNAAGTAHFVGQFQLYSNSDELRTRKLEHHEYFHFTTTWQYTEPSELPGKLSILVQQLSEAILKVL